MGDRFGRLVLENQRNIRTWVAHYEVSSSCGFVLTMASWAKLVCRRVGQAIRNFQEILSKAGLGLTGKDLCGQSGYRRCMRYLHVEQDHLSRHCEDGPSILDFGGILEMRYL